MCTGMIFSMGNAVVLQVPKLDEWMPFVDDGFWKMSISLRLQIGHPFGHLYSLFTGVSLDKITGKRNPGEVSS